jgi:hypothetical protein
MSLRGLNDSKVFDWLAESNRPWQELVTTGPAGYETYARVTSRSSSRGVDADNDVMRAGVSAETSASLLNYLCHIITTDVNVYCAFWVGGWGAPKGGALAFLPNRSYRLFELRDDASATIKGQYFAAVDPIPAFVWPSDRSWVFSADTDADFIGIAGSGEVIASIDAGADEVIEVIGKKQE